MLKKHLFVRNLLFVYKLIKVESLYRVIANRKFCDDKQTFQFCFKIRAHRSLGESEIL